MAKTIQSAKRNENNSVNNGNKRKYHQWLNNAMAKANVNENINEAND